MTDNPPPQQPYPGQAYPQQPYPGQPYPGQPYPGQPYPGQAYPQQPYPGQPYAEQPYSQQPYSETRPPQTGARHRYRPAFTQPAGQPYMQPYPPVLYRQPPMRVAPKSPSAAIILSFLIPGVGSMYAGRAGIGALILGCYVVSCLLSLALIGIPFVIATWVWGMIHAHGAAVRWNQQHGILS
jgi:TM2 domain-containing membrane protein YozV